MGIYREFRLSRTMLARSDHRPQSSASVRGFDALAAVLLILMAANAAAESVRCEKGSDFANRVHDRQWQLVRRAPAGVGLEGQFARISRFIRIEGRLPRQSKGTVMMRLNLDAAAFGATNSIQLRIRGDGESYHFSIFTGLTFRQQPIYYSTRFETDADNGWQDVVIPLATLKPNVFGQIVRAPQLDRRRIRNIAVSISGSDKAAFRLDIASISACAA